MTVGFESEEGVSYSFPVRLCKVLPESLANMHFSHSPRRFREIPPGRYYSAAYDL